MDHVVAVADEDHLAVLDAAQRLHDRQRVSQHLARVVVVRQPVHHRHRRRASQRQQVAVREQARHDEVVVPAQAARNVAARPKRTRREPQRAAVGRSRCGAVAWRSQLARCAGLRAKQAVVWALRRGSKAASRARVAPSLFSLSQLDVVRPEVYGVAAQPRKALRAGRGASAAPCGREAAAQRQTGGPTLSPRAGVPPAAREGRLTHRFEGDARAQAGFCENHGHGHAAQRLVGHVPGAIPRLQLHGARQHRVQLRLCQVVDVQEVRGRRAGRAAAAPRRNGGESGGRGLRALRARWRDSATTGAAPRRAEARHGSRWLPHWCVHRAATDRPNAKHGAGRGEAL